MEEKEVNEIVKNVRVHEELTSLAEDIEETSSWIYKGGKAPLSEKIKGKVSEDFRSIVAALERRGQIPLSRKEQTAFLKDIKKSLEQLPVIKLTLAFLPNKEFLTQMIDWLEKQLGKKVVLDITVKERIIAGCTFEYDGEYRDYSLVNKLNDVIEEGIKRVT